MQNGSTGFTHVSRWGPLWHWARTSSIWEPSIPSCLAIGQWNWEGLTRWYPIMIQWYSIIKLKGPKQSEIKLDQVNSANLLFELWSMDTVAMDIMIYDSTGPLQGSTGWYLMVLGQYGVILVVTRWYWVSITWYWLVLIGIEWYWVNKGLLCLYILKELMVTSTNRPTDQPTNQQGKYRAICLFEC